MKVKKLINNLKKLNQNLEIGVMDDNCELNIKGVYFGNGSYTLAGYFNDELENYSGNKWKEFK